MQISITKPVQVDTLEVTLPIYYKINDRLNVYGVITEDMRMLEMYERSNGSIFSIDTRQYDELSEVEAHMQGVGKKDFEVINEAVFHHKFMVHHREMFYVLFPDARPTI